MVSGGGCSLTRATRGHCEDVYACPLCMQGFQSPNQFTREHVPPRAVGGREMVLTCAPCNNTAGAEMDSHGDLAQRGENFIAGELSKRTKAHLRIGNDSVPVTLTATGDQVQLIGVPKASEPAALRRNTEHYEAATTLAANLEFHIDFAAHHSRKAQIAHLRAGYLAVFAKLGYRYVAGLNIIREQFAFPDKELIPHFHAALEHGVLGDLGIFLGKADEIGPCMVVSMRPYSVILPPPFTHSDAAFWDSVRDHATGGSAFQFQGSPIGWPVTREYLLDR